MSNNTISRAVGSSDAMPLNMKSRPTNKNANNVVSCTYHELRAILKLQNTGTINQEEETKKGGNSVFTSSSNNTRTSPRPFRRIYATLPAEVACG